MYIPKHFRYAAICPTSISTNSALRHSPVSANTHTPEIRRCPIHRTIRTENILPVPPQRTHTHCPEGILLAQTSIMMPGRGYSALYASVMDVNMYANNSPLNGAQNELFTFGTLSILFFLLLLFIPAFAGAKVCSAIE